MSIDTIMIYHVLPGKPTAVWHGYMNIRTTNPNHEVIIRCNSHVSHVMKLIQNSTYPFHQEFPAAMGARMVGVGNRLLETALSQTRHVVNPSGSDDLREVGMEHDRMVILLSNGHAIDHGKSVVTG